MQIISGFILVTAQVYLFGQFNILNYAFCIVYTSFIFSAPVSNGLMTNVFLAFIAGMLVDIPNNTLGINALAAVNLAFFRLKIFSLITYQSPDEQMDTQYTLKGVGFFNFTLFVFLGTLFYSLIYFCLFSWGWVFFWKNILRSMSTAGLSTMIILFINVLFYRTDRDL